MCYQLLQLTHTFNLSTQPNTYLNNQNSNNNSSSNNKFGEHTGCSDSSQIVLQCSQCPPSSALLTLEITPIPSDTQWLQASLPVKDGGLGVTC